MAQPFLSSATLSHTLVQRLSKCGSWAANIGAAQKIVIDSWDGWGEEGDGGEVSQDLLNQKFKVGPAICVVRIIQVTLMLTGF